MCRLPVTFISASSWHDGFNANLPFSACGNGKYQVWVKNLNNDARRSKDRGPIYYVLYVDSQNFSLLQKSSYNLFISLCSLNRVHVRIDLKCIL